MRQPPGGADLRVGVFGVLLDHACGEVLGTFDDELVVEQEERLRGDGGDVASLAVRVHVRQVERRQGRGGAAATLLQVDRAAVDRGGGSVDLEDDGLIAVEDLDARDHAAVAGLADGDRRAEALGVEFAADREHRVADGLGVEPADAVSAEEGVIRVGRLGGVMAGGLAVSAAEHHLTVHRLEAPAGLDEASGQVVEEFRVRRAFAEHPEVAGGIDDPAAEVMQPDPVHERPAHERVLTGGQPIGVGETSAGRRQLRVVDRDGGVAEDGELAGGDGLARLGVVAAVVEFALRRRVHRLDEHAEASFGRLGRAQGGRLGALGEDLVVGRLVVEIQAEGRLGREVFLDQRRLLLGALGDGRIARDAVGGALGFGHLEDLLLEDHVEGVLVHLRGLGVDDGGLFLDLGGLGLVGRRVERDRALGGILPLAPVEGRVEDRAQAEIVDLADRVVAMVVALRAGDRQAGERGRHDAQRVGDALVLGQCEVGDGVAGAVGPHAEEGRGGEAFELGRVEHRGRDVGGRDTVEFVAGQLLLDEAIPRLVGVERADDVVAVAPGVRSDRIRVRVAVGVGVPRDVQPMAAPAFAVGFGSQQPVDQFREGVGGGVGDERGGLGRRRRQAGQIEGRATDERGAIGLGREVEPVGFQFLADERVDRSEVRSVGELRHGGLGDRLEGPELPVAGGDVSAVGQGAGWFGLVDLRAGLDPGFEQGELSLRHFLTLLRHLAVAGEREYRALLGLARRQHRRAVLRLAVHEATQAQVDASLGLLLLAVTMRAVLLQDRADLRLVVRCVDGTQAGRGDEARAEQGDGMAKRGGHGSEGSDKGFRQSSVPRVTARISG